MINQLDELSEMIYDQDEATFFDTISGIDFDISAYNSSDHTLLHVAAKVEGSKNIIVKLIELGVNVNITDKEGNSPLHDAVNYNCPMNLITLLEFGADSSIKNNQLNTPLHVACSGNNYECARILIDNKANVNLLGGNGKTPIVKAVEAEVNTELIELLLDNGADINSGDGVTTPLMVAISYNNRELIKYLLSKGSKIEGYKNRNGEDALVFAKRLGNQEIIDILARRLG